MRPMLFVENASSGEMVHILPIEFLRKYARAIDSTGVSVVIKTGRRIPGGPDKQHYTMTGPPGSTSDVIGAMMALVADWKAATTPRQRSNSKCGSALGKSRVRKSSTGMQVRRTVSILPGDEHTDAPDGDGAGFDLEDESFDGFGSAASNGSDGEEVDF